MSSVGEETWSAPTEGSNAGVHRADHIQGHRPILETVLVTVVTEVLLGSFSKMIGERDDGA